MGVPVKTLYQWLKRGAKELARMVEAGVEEPAPAEALYVSLLAAHRQTNALTQARALHTINEAARSNWQAAAWLMERRWPAAWSARERKQQAEARERIKDLEKQVTVLQAAQAECDPESEERLAEAWAEFGEAISKSINEAEEFERRANSAATTADTLETTP